MKTNEEAGGMPCDGGPCQNTDRHLWPLISDDYYAPRIHVTKEGNIGIDVGGHVFVKPLREWHWLAINHTQSELAARQSAETIAEQKREIERLISALIKYGDHKAGCKEQSTMDACTCGLDEVLK